MGKRYKCATTRATGEYCVDDLFRSNPKFAVISMEENKNANALDLARNLYDQGIKEIRFYDDLSQHPSLQDKLIPGSTAVAFGLPPFPGNHMPKPPNSAMTALQNLAESPLTSQQELFKSVIEIPPLPPAKNGKNHVQNPLMYNTSNNSATQISASLPLPYSLPIDSKAILAAFLKSTVARPPSVRRPSLTPAPVPSTVITPMSFKPPKEKPLSVEYVKCTRCNDMVQITKHIAMANHTKKHLGILENRCTECPFQNAVWNPVVNHMKKEHGIENPIPIKNNPEEHPDYNQLFETLFPNHSALLEKVRQARNQKGRFSLNGLLEKAPNPPVVPVKEAEPPKEPKEEKRGRKRKMDKPRRIPQDVPDVPEEPVQNPIRRYRCIECPIDRYIDCLAGRETLSDHHLVHHLRLHHANDCVLFKCEECGYKNVRQSVVRQHIFYRHMEQASKISVLQSRHPDWRLVLPKFYPDLILQNILPPDFEEAHLEMIANNPIVSDHLIQTSLFDLDEKPPKLVRMDIEEGEPVNDN